MSTPATPPATVPASTRALVVHAVDDLRVEERPLPAAAPDEALVRVTRGGVCGTDLHYVSHGAAGESVLREPMVLGHEVVGVVEAAAADGSGPPAGTRVALHPGGTVDPAAPHPPGRPNLSPAATWLGSAARLPHRPGAFARHVLSPTAALRVVPDGVPEEAAALAEPASVAWHAVAQAGDVTGRHVLVVGSGPIGCLVVAVLKRAGAGRVTVTDVHRAALDRALALGADDALLATDDAEAIAALGADVAFESSGSPRGFAAVVGAVRPGGRVVLVGLQPPGDVPAPLAKAIVKELVVTGSFRFTEEMTEVLAALADGSLVVDGVVSHEFDLDEAAEAFAVARDASASGKVLLRF